MPLKTFGFWSTGIMPLSASITQEHRGQFGSRYGSNSLSNFLFFSSSEGDDDDDNDDEGDGATVVAVWYAVMDTTRETEPPYFTSLAIGCCRWLR